MSEESVPSAAETARRRPAASSSESSGGGAKVLAAVLVVAVVGLAFALYKRNASAGEQSAADAKLMHSLSNQVAELSTKLALERGNLEVAQSNQQALLYRRTTELVTTSNRLVQTGVLLDHLREEARIAQAAIATRAADLATVEAHRDDLLREAAVIPALRREVAELKDKLQQRQFAHASLQETLGQVRSERAELERKLEDPAFLKLQARRAEEAAELYRQAAAGRRIRTADKRLPLELQPDGTVRPAFPVTNDETK
jgi:hypothetical protein